MQAVVVPSRPERPKAVVRNAAATVAAPRAGVHVWAQASGRMLVATFFIASAVSNISDSHFDFSAIAHADSSILFNAVIYSMAFAVLVGRYMNIAALVLALVMLGSSSIQLANGAQQLAGYWQDLAVIGALFYMAATHRSGAAQGQSLALTRSRAVTPRRVVPEGRLLDDGVPGADRQVSRNHVARPVAMPIFASRRNANQS